MWTIVDIFNRILRFFIQYYLDSTGLFFVIPGAPPVVGTIKLLNHLRALLNTGYPLHTALEHIQKYDIPHIRNLKLVIRDLENGERFSASFGRRFRWLSSKMTCRVLEIAEKKGLLTEMLDAYIDYIVIKADIKHRRYNTLYYPVLILLICLIVLGILTIFVIPVFQAMYSDYGAQLPLMTRIVISLLDVVKGNMVFIPLLVIIVVLLIKKMTDGQNRLNNYFILLLVKEMTKSGDSVTTAFSEASYILGTQKYQKLAADLVHEEQNGLPLSLTTPKGATLLQQLVSTIISTSRAQDKVKRLDQYIAGFQVRQQIWTERVFRRLEFYALLANGLWIGFIVISMYLPIFRMISAIGDL